MLNKISVDYDFSVVLTADYNQHSGSCLFHQARENPTIYRDGKHIESFNDHNTVIHQLWWSRDQLDFDLLEQQLGLDIVTISSIRQDPGNVIPYHFDQFRKMQQMFPDRTDRKVRANLFLEDSKVGHFLQFANGEQMETAHSWKKNQGYLFDSTVPHLSCNAGIEPKYTLQISGFLRQEQ